VGEPQQAELVQLQPEVSQLLQQARAPSTNAAYGRAFKQWSDWANQYPEVIALPAEPLHVAFYLTHISRSAKSFAVINLALCSIAWAHTIAGLASPSKDVFVSEVVNGIKRKLAKPSTKKDPIEPQNIEQIFDIINYTSLTDVRNSTIIIIAYYALLRFDELRSIKSSHLAFLPGHVEITIPKSKADQLRLGNSVLVARLGGPWCPVLLLEYYLRESALAGSSDNEDNFIFRRCLTNKGKVCLSSKACAISYNSVRTLVKAKMSQLGLNPSSFGTHSMRAGGATTAANSDVKDRVLQRHGCWASVSSKDRYIKDSVASRLVVSQRLGGAGSSKDLDS
jgi:integrase